MSIICTAHSSESVVTFCLDSPVLKADGSPTGLYHLAGEFCPDERQKQICYPDYEREQVGSASADDAAWRYETASGHGSCTVHTEAPVTEPDPNDPGNTQDPNIPFFPQDPNNPGTTTPDPNIPSIPEVPVTPLPPMEGMVG